MSSSFGSIKEYYGKVLQSSKDLKTNACCLAQKAHPVVRELLSKIPNEVLEKFYGCGFTVPLSINGLHVLDLGSGSGRDAYLAAALVGESGHVTGIDMTDEQLDVANKNIKQYTETLGYQQPNLKFVKGFIETPQDAGIQQNSMDLVISNCVINLSPHKKQVLQQVYNVLKEGGEFYFSDVYCDRRLPPHLFDDPILLGECLSGALYTQDFYRLCRQVGFMDPRIVSQAPITINNKEIENKLGQAKFMSITFRLFKLKDLEDKCEDYGQVAIYKGTYDHSPHFYVLDDHHTFFTGKPALVCGNTASMLQDSVLLRSHFTIIGDRSTHFGLFDCGPAPANSSPSASACGSSCC